MLVSQAADDGGEPGRRRPALVVGPGVTVRGDIEGPTDLHIQGEVVGSVTAMDVVVDDGARVAGPVVAGALTVRGRITGAVQAQSVRLCATARLEGDVVCDSLQVDVGARFSGQCLSDDAPPRASSPEIAHEMAPPAIGARDELLRLAARLRALR